MGAKTGRRKKTVGFFCCRSVPTFRYSHSFLIKRKKCTKNKSSGLYRIMAWENGFGFLAWTYNVLKKVNIFQILFFIIV